jgi:hypothetical protein
MKIQIERNHISIIPESEQDRSYLEDTLGLKENGMFINLRRINEVALGLGEDKTRFSLITEKA